MTACDHSAAPNAAIRVGADGHGAPDAQQHHATAQDDDGGGCTDRGKEVRPPRDRADEDDLDKRAAQHSPQGVAGRVRDTEEEGGRDQLATVLARDRGGEGVDVNAQ